MVKIYTKKSKNDDRLCGTLSQPFVNKTGNLMYKTNMRAVCCIRSSCLQCLRFSDFKRSVFYAFEKSKKRDF